MSKTHYWPCPPGREDECVVMWGSHGCCKPRGHEGWCSCSDDDWPDDDTPPVRIGKFAKPLDLSAEEEGVDVSRYAPCTYPYYSRSGDDLFFPLWNDPDSLASFNEFMERWNARETA